jgi:hypothetical protein
MGSSLLPRAADGLWIEGPAGAGKTSAAAAHLRALLDDGVPATEVLVLLPQRELSGPYREVADAHVGGRVPILTISGLARRMIQRFWPLAAEPAGFDPARPPTFLTLETAQYFMSRVVDPLMEEGAFAGLSILESRLYSQLLDNLNKAALVGFPPGEIADRLRAAWIGGEDADGVFTDVQRAADRYLALCREHNLLDFSLQLRVFLDHLWEAPACRRHLTGTVRHLIADNVEEGVPATHDLLLDWMPALDSSVVLFDRDGGVRQFLGADPDSARRLEGACAEREAVERDDPPLALDAEGDGEPVAVSLADLGERVMTALSPHEPAPPDDGAAAQALRKRIDVIYKDTYPEMLEGVAEQVQDVIRRGAAPEDVVVVAPFLSDTVRYTLSNALDALGIPYLLRRPSRPLSKEPAVRALLALTAVGHPGWKVQLDVRDVAQALSFSIADLDMIRAHLLAEAVFEVDDGRPRLRGFAQLSGDRQERVTYRLGRRYDGLRKWIGDYASGEAAPVDHFLNRLFGEVLSQDGYGFHDNFEAAALADSLVESARKFRRVLEEAGPGGTQPVGRLYLETVRSGVAAAQYVQSWEADAREKVLLTPAHTFLVQDRTAEHQFWLDVGSTGWHSRIRQPLTHPHVLSRSWDGGTWTDADEHEAGLSLLRRLTVGLTRRCTGRVHLAIAAHGQNGEKERGYLLKAFQHFFGRARA